MIFDEIKTAFGLNTDTLRDGFDASMATIHEADAFLSREFIEANTTRLAMSGEIARLYIDSLTLFDDVRAKALFWHCRRSMASGGNANHNHWGVPSGVPHASMLYGFVVLSFVPDVFAMNKRHGIPDEITRETLADIERWIHTNKQRYGDFGFREIGWLSNHVHGKLYSLGRLQFHMEPFAFDDIVLRRNDGSVVVLAPGGLQYRRDGLYNGANGIADANSKTTVFRESDAFFEGNVISPVGRITGTVAVFPKSEYRLAVSKGDNALSFHIPAGSPMEHGACGESFARAREFFPRYFPEYKEKAFFSTSWLYDHELEKVLPPASNIVKFLREFYLLPLVEANDNQMFERVFLKRYDNIDEAPQTTSVQTAIVAHMKAGGRFRNAKAILLPKDAGWNAPYRE
jgi:hypothetical protein